MTTSSVPGVSKPVSRVVLGTMIISSERRDESFALLDAAAAAGITTLDTAHGYGGGASERGIGAWMAERGNREDVVVLSKGCHHNADRKRVTPFDVATDLHDSLARLQTDYVDIWLFHRDDPAVPVGELVDALNQHIDAGRIRAYGGSNWSHERIEEANRYAERHGLVPFTASSPNFGLAEQVEDPWGPGCVSLSGPQNADARAWYERTGLAVFAYSSLGRGLFSGKITRENAAETADGACRKAYCHEVNFRRLDRARELAATHDATVAQIALAFVFNSLLNAHALVGAASAEECRAAAAAQDIRLSEAEMAYLDLQGDSPR